MSYNAYSPRILKIFMRCVKIFLNTYLEGAKLAIYMETFSYQADTYWTERKIARSLLFILFLSKKASLQVDAKMPFNMFYSALYHFTMTFLPFTMLMPLTSFVNLRPSRL